MDGEDECSWILFDEDFAIMAEKSTVKQDMCNNIPLPLIHLIG